MNTKNFTGVRLGAKTTPTDPVQAAKVAKEKEDEFRQKVKKILRTKKGEK